MAQGDFWALISWPMLAWAGHRAQLFLLPPSSDPALVSQGVVDSQEFIDSTIPLLQRTFFTLLNLPQISLTDKQKY